MRNHRRRADTECLGEREHEHHQISRDSDGSDCLFAERSDPVKVREQIKSLHHLADRHERRHVQQVSRYRAFGHVFHAAHGLRSLVKADSPTKIPTASGKHAAMRSVSDPRSSNQAFIRSARSGENNAPAIPAMRTTRPITRMLFGVRVADAAKKSNPPRITRTAATTYNPFF